LKTMSCKQSLRNQLELPNCGRDWKKSWPRSHQSSVRNQWCPQVIQSSTLHTNFWPSKNPQHFKL